MDSLNNIYYKIKPIFHTIIFEIRLQMKKFIIFSGITFVLLFLSSYIAYIFDQPLQTQVQFYEFGITYFPIVIVLAVSFFFGVSICSEFKNKTGLEILPLINRHKLILGKFLANLVLVVGIITVYYLTMALFAYNFFGGPLLKTLLYSFGFAVLYTLALGSIATFLSSFLRSITPVIIIMVGYIFIGDLIISSLIMNINKELEPLYSFNYLFEIIENILDPYFSTKDRRTMDGYWRFPSIEGALTLLSLYIVLFLILGTLLFKRREL